MAKSSKKQCRKPKPKRQGGGLVVVSARNLQAAANNKKPTLPQARKIKPKKKKDGGVFGELMASRDRTDSDDFDTPPTPIPSHASALGGEVRQSLFSSAHSREQRLYYLLATRARPQAGGGASGGEVPAADGGCHAVVFVETIAVAQELLAVLKALSLAAFAVHERTPKAQAQDHAKRFSSAVSAERSSVLILTNAAVSRSPSIGSVPTAKGLLLRIVHYDAPEGPKNAAARGRVAQVISRGRCAGMAEEIHLEGGGDAAGLPPFAFESAVMSGVHSRLVVAKKLARAVALSAGEGHEKGMQRAAAAAGLEWDEGGGHGESGAEAVQREKQRAHAQQATALREKMSVLLCQQLLPTAQVAGASDASTPNVQASSKELRKKMAVLGMILGPQRAGVNSNGGAGDRATAQTRWLDGAAGKAFGGTWDGSVRTGASCDSASLDMRSRLEAAKQAHAGRASGATAGGDREGGGSVAKALAKWKPNPDTPDADRWGGRWGKPCGHNEIVLQHLRPFAPMEVVNTRVCSKASPAPGNSGFDGCLELLSLTCQAHSRALTVWDDTSFLHLDKAGVCSTLPKQAMLHLSLPSLRFLVKNMRSFTTCSEGQEPPRALARAVLRSAGWGAKQSKFGPLSAELSTRVMSFVLSGDLATWKSVASGFGFGAVRKPRAAPIESNPRDSVAFASKKKRKNFNL